MDRSARRALRCAAIAIAAAAWLPAVAAAHDDRGDRALRADTRFYVPPPSAGAVQQAADLARAGRAGDAALVGAMERQPRAVWFTGGTPEEVRASVAATMRAADRGDRVPVLVAYDVPGRDCSQFSAGGAEGTAAYAAWIDGFARGIGDRRAVVVLEPDGLALAPTDCGGTAEQGADRNAQIAGAAARLRAQRRTSVYLDAGHDNWHTVGDMTARLVAGGVDRADGFFLNVSNFRADDGLVRYGTMISKCLFWAQHLGGDPAACPNQFWPPADADAWFAANVPAPAAALTHFVIDTSRNGRGPWDPSPYRAAPFSQTGDLQDWCDPPARGLGARPTASTGTPLLDAKLWVKVPGESDGQCNRSWDYGVFTKPEWPTDPAQRALFDPVREAFDPAAGAWFPDMALELARNAAPPLR